MLSLKRKEIEPIKEGGVGDELGEYIESTFHDR
jgi:hypothetical protein